MKPIQATSGIEIIKEYMPEITSLKTLLSIIISTGVVIILVHILNTIDWWIPLVVAMVANALTYWTMSRISQNAEKIRKTYRRRYKNDAYRKFFYHYLIPVIPPNVTAMFLIIMVENSSFLPMLYPSYENNILYRSIIPWPLAIPLGLFLIALYPIMSRDAVNGGFTLDTELFLYIIYPEKAKILQDGVYEYIRHPHYAEGLYMCFGFALLSQNIIAFIFALLFSITYYFIARSEDKELIRRVGPLFEEYVNNKPCFLPKFREMIPFFKFIFTRRSI